MSFDDPELEPLARSFLLGTARNPAPVGDALRRFIGSAGPLTELTALALLGQRMRFRKHGPPPANGTAVAIQDARAIVPDAARPLMRRLVGDTAGAAADLASLVLADACQRRRLRPHPFDLPRLAGFVKAHGELLGSYASAWATRGEEVDQPRGYFEADVIDETNWTAARPAARAAFIANLRAREPERARALVEASFTSDVAPVRARLLGALAHGLSTADVPFLEGLAKDRAPSVREEAQRLLKSIPGTPAAESRMRDLVSRTRISTAGLSRQRKALALERPANLPAFTPGEIDPARRWAIAEYAGLGLDAIAAGFGLSISEMIAAATDDAALTALFARQASIERRLDVLAAIVRDHAGDAWIDAVGTDDAGLPDDATIEQWCTAALAPELWPSLPAAADLERLYRFLRRPLPPRQARELLHGRAFATLHDAASADGGMPEWSALAIAALVPAALRSGLRAALALLPGEAPSRALLLLDCLTLVDPSTENEPS